MAEFYIGMIPDVDFNLLPIPVVITNFFTRGADWQHAAELLDIEECLFQVRIGRFQIVFRCGQLGVELFQFLIPVVQFFL